MDQRKRRQTEDRRDAFDHGFPRDHARIDHREYPEYVPVERGTRRNERGEEISAHLGGFRADAGAEKDGVERRGDATVVNRTEERIPVHPVPRRRQMHKRSQYHLEGENRQEQAEVSHDASIDPPGVEGERGVRRHLQGGDDDEKAYAADATHENVLGEEVQDPSKLEPPQQVKHQPDNHGGCTEQEE